MSYAQETESFIKIRCKDSVCNASGIVSNDEIKADAERILTTKFNKSIDIADIQVRFGARQFNVFWKTNLEKMLSSSMANGDIPLFFSDKTPPRNEIYPPIKDEILNASILLTDGTKTKLAETQGKLVIISFVDIRTAPSRDIVADLAKLERKYAGYGIVILGLSTDMDTAARQRFTRFVSVQKIPFKTGWIEPPLTWAFFHLSKFPGTPQTFVIFDGRLRGIFHGNNSLTRRQLFKFVNAIADSNPQRDVP